VEAVALCQLGSGSSLMGYYMFHGGQNPDGKLTTLQESQATGYPNDLPVKNYDFNAPIGEYGQLNPQYFWLRRLHLFLHDFGSALAQMPAAMPELQPTNKTDLITLRWAVRSDGNSGFVFVNNYQRLQAMPPKKNVRFRLNLPDREFVFPQKAVTIPANEFFFWPFNLDLGGVKLLYATAQPICGIDNGRTHTFYFAQTPGVKAEFIFDPATLASKISEFKNIKPGRKPAIQLQSANGKSIQIVLLNEADSLALQKADGKVVFDKSQKHSIAKVKVELLKPAGPPREIPMSAGKSHIAIAPTDGDFTNAAVWKIKLPSSLDLNRQPLLRIHYVGDVARLTLNGKLLDDDFYSGRNFEIGLNRYAPEILNGDLRLQILPLRKDAPIFFEPKARVEFGLMDSIATLKSAVIINER
jgi:hypothetical protein